MSPLTDTDSLQPWGWSIPFTQLVISSFDVLANLLAPHDEEARIPGSRMKIPGSIRPRTKSLQQIVRSVMFFSGSERDMEEISGFMGRMKRPIEKLLGGEDVRELLASLGGEGGSRSHVGLRRRKDGLNGELRKRVLIEIEMLEERTRNPLLDIEGVLWPRKIIKLGPGSQPPSPSPDLEQDGKNSSIFRALIWIRELVEELYEDGGELMKEIVGSNWGIVAITSALVVLLSWCWCHYIQ